MAEKKSQKQGKVPVPQPYVDILEEACKGLSTKLRFELYQGDKRNPAVPPTAFTCDGFLNDALVGVGQNLVSGRAARNDCAHKIIDSIFRHEIVIEDAMYQNLSDAFPLYMYLDRPALSIRIYAKPSMKRRMVVPYFMKQMTGSKRIGWRIPEKNIGCQMLRKMGWAGGGLPRRQGQPGIEEPVIMENDYRKREGLGFAVMNKQNDQPRQPKKPIVTRRFMKDFAMGDDQTIAVDLPAPMSKDHLRILTNLCKVNCMEYEFVEGSCGRLLNIWKPDNWAATLAGKRMARRKEIFRKKLQALIN